MILSFFKRNIIFFWQEAQHGADHYDLVESWLLGHVKVGLFLVRLYFQGISLLTGNNLLGSQLKLEVFISLLSTLRCFESQLWSWHPCQSADRVCSVLPPSAALLSRPC